MKRFKKSRLYLLIKNTSKKVFSRKAKNKKFIDDRQEIDTADKVLLEWPSGLAKPRVGLVKDYGHSPYWTKFERFLKNNEITYEYYNIHASTWLVDAQEFDIIVWRPNSTPIDLEEARRKIFILEGHLGKICYPSFATLTMYEDKIMQYELLNYYKFPVIKTFVSHDLQECKDKIEQHDYPVISKLISGSGSLGVELVKSRNHASIIVNDAFSFSGRTTYWPYLKHKDYVFFQEYVKNDGYDLRVVVVGNHVFGYFRDVPKDDYRASGMGQVRKTELPEDAIQLARKVAKQFNYYMIAVDMLRESEAGHFYIIEISSFIRVETPEQLHVNGVPGAYTFADDGQYSFNQGKYWVQEIVLKDLISNEWINKRNH